MKIRVWRNFLRVAETGSVTRVADRLNISQSALSRDIRELEEQFSVRLFQRHGRGVELTEAGRILQRRAEAILRQLGDLPSELRAAVDQPFGEVTFGMPPSISAMLTGHVIETFRTRYPHVRVRVREGSALQLRDALTSREIEFGVMSLPLADPQFSTQPLATDAMVLIGPRSAQLDALGELDLRAAVERPLILTPRPNSLRLLIENACEPLGVQPQVMIETETGLVMELIRRGLGFTIGPSSSLKGDAELRQLSCAPIRDLCVTWVVAQLRETTLSIGCRRLLELVHETVQTLIDEGHWPAAHALFAQDDQDARK